MPIDLDGPEWGFGELANGYAQLRIIRVKSAPVADDGFDADCWGHPTALRPASRQMSEPSAGSGGLDGLRPGGDYVGMLEAGSDKKG